AHLIFDIHDPWKDNRVTKFTLVHEKPFHAFIVSEDLQFFVHDHPVWKDNAFQYDTVFPEAATPQLIAKTVIVGGIANPVTPLKKDYSGKQSENLKVELATVPADPIAGQNAQLRFTLGPSEGLEKYLGAWG